MFEDPWPVEFENETSFSSAAARTQLIYRDLIQTVVVVKGTFAVTTDGEVRPALHQLPVLLEDAETADGPLETEIVPTKSGCDAAVLGSAHSPGGRPIGSMLVSVQIGDLRRDLRVFGDRLWTRTPLGLRPSTPLPFTTMPLTYDRAYGGEAPENDEVTSQWFPNPAGRGFLLRKQDAEGTPLPNLEEPRQLIAHWNDAPPVAGVAPLPRQSTLRAARGVVVDAAEQTTTLGPDAFSWAHPGLKLPSYPAGGEVKLTGTRPGRPWRFRLPAFSLSLQLALGDRRYVLPLVPDTVYLLPSSDQVAVVARCAFIYQFVPERLRTMRIVSASEATTTMATSATDITTIGRERAAVSPLVPLELDVGADLAFLPVKDWVARHPLAAIIDNLPLCASS